MSLIITIHVGEGIVMASDSRTTYNSQDLSPLPDGKGVFLTQKQGIHYSDTTCKTFLTQNRIGISTCGDASINNLPMAGFVEKFIHDYITEETDICEVPNLLLEYFRSFSPIPNTTFHVAGYSVQNEVSEQKVYLVYVLENRFEEINTASQGATWNGETEILSRIITSLWVQKKQVEEATGEESVTYDEIKSPPIPWNFFSLQDGIDFAKYAINTTIETMRFQLRLKTVGGPIDILILKPDDAFWVSHKALYVQERNSR